MPQKKEWTLMFYFASDNPLAPSIIPQLKSIKQAGFHQQVNVIAQFDPQSEGTPTHIFDINLVNKLKARERSQVGFTGFDVDDPFVSNLIEDKLWRDQKDRRGNRIKEQLKQSLLGLSRPVFYDPPEPPPDTKLTAPTASTNGAAASTNGALAAALAARAYDSGRGRTGERRRDVELNPRESLRAFLKFCAEAYPAHHYILFILGHGVVVGNDIFLFDEHADEQSLSLKGLGDVLRWFKKYLDLEVPGTEFELASFHSCSVSSLEVAYELQGAANYMLASQGPAFVGSWPYRQILLRLFKDTDDLIGLEEKVQLAQEPEEKKRLDESVREKIAGSFQKITDYCFHNNKDFLLAGYSFDVALCKLGDVSGYLTESVVALKDALVAGLSIGGNPLLKNLIQLAHLEAQSNWQESYVDLCDFCFCLGRQCRTFRETLGENAGAALGETLERLENIVKACDAVTDLFPKDMGGGSEGIVVKNEFIGPEQQYSHGLSVYFPWSEPLEDRLILADYEQYEFNVKTKWRDFLQQYFDETQRRSRQAEINDEIQRRIEAAGNGDRVFAPVLMTTQQLKNEELSEDLASLVFNGGGELSGENSLATLTDKVNPRDRTGDGCACASIKNYPRDTRDLRKRQREAAIPTKEGDVLVPFSKESALLAE
jgi:hypothetical protein